MDAREVQNHLLLSSVSSFGMKYDDRGDDNISPHDIKPLQVLADEKILKRFLCVSLEPRVRRIGVVDIVPYKEFLDKLWNGDFS